jgi:small GTP-binding protein
MPMPHRIQMQLIRRRLVGKEGTERIRELRAVLTELPDYRNGPYADIRKWVTAEIGNSRARSKVVHRDSIAVRREGVAQVALVGPPNAGKSSLLQALSNIQIKTGDYAFTTLRPAPALVRIHGVLVQVVEIPGLIEGANDGRGGGRSLLGVLRGADAIVFCHDASADPAGVEAVRREVAEGGIEQPAVLAVTKADEAGPGAIARLARRFPDIPVVAVSVLDDDSVEAFRETVWDLTGLLTVRTRRPGSTEEDPMALRPGATVRDVAAGLHKELAETVRTARLWGPSARHPGQRVGRTHVVMDGDVLELLVSERASER